MDLQNFVVTPAIMLILIFSVKFRWLPAYGAEEPAAIIMPAVALGTGMAARISRLTRSSMLETLRQDYMTTARSKGLSERVVINKHALPNGLIPVVTIGGLTMIGLFNGVVITETVFNYPGMGSLMAEAALSLDVVTVLGITLFSSFILVAGNLLVDVLYGIIDPRIRLE